MFSWMRPKSRVFSSVSRIGVLSNSDAGLLRLIHSIEANQRALVLSMDQGSAR